MEIKSIAQSICENTQKVGGIRQVYFVACGGSFGAFYSANFLLATEAKKIRAGHYTSNEFVHAPPAALGENSVVVVCSHAGDTPETVKAAQLSKEKGATVVALTYTPGSPITQYSHHVLGYRFRTDTEVPIGQDKALQPLTLAVELLHQTEGYGHYDTYYKGLEEIDATVRRAQKQVQKRAIAFANTYKDDPFIYTMGSGAAFGAAYIQSICIFMEMQWVNSSSIHSGEYFHGPFEITDTSVPFMLQISEGKTRALDERALRFLSRYAKRVEVLDAKELGLSVIDANVVDYFNQTLFTCVYDVYNAAFAEARNHPLSVRRYMWKVEY